MRSKAPLAMMEQMVMILVFALAAALCLQAFVKSDQLSRRSEARDRAAVLCQSAAEVIRASGGDFQQAAELLGTSQYTEDTLMIDYDQNWAAAEDVMRYTLGVSRVDSGVSGLGTAAVWLRDEDAETEDGAELFRIEVSWQEVSAHE